MAEKHEMLPDCREQFGKIAHSLGIIEGTLKGMHHEMVSTNGHISHLYGRTDDAKEAMLGILASLKAIELRLNDTRDARTKWNKRAWALVAGIAIGVALLIAGMVFKKL